MVETGNGREACCALIFCPRFRECLVICDCKLICKLLSLFCCESNMDFGTGSGSGEDVMFQCIFFSFPKNLTTGGMR